MGAYAGDRRWSDKYIPLIKRIVGPHLLRPSSLVLDTKQATDLVLFRARDMRIAARVRRPSASFVKYQDEFTIRFQRDSGAKTELSKILEGWGDWLFYGFVTSSDAIGVWYLVDLDSFRFHYSRNQTRLQIFTRSNKDGTSFKAFNVWSFPDEPPILVACSDELSSFERRQQFALTVACVTQGT